MESTRTSIFTFDHGQRKLNKAIGVEESYLSDLQEKIGETLKNYLFDEDKNIKDDLYPSMLVEILLQEYSYNQLVLISSFFLQNKLDEFASQMEKRIDKAKMTIKKIAIDSDDIPPHIREMLLNLTKDDKGDTKSTPINGDNLPKEVKDFLDNLARNAEDADEEDDDV